MCTEPATVPSRKPSFEAVASSWIEPLTSAAMLRGVRYGPVQATCGAAVSLIGSSVARSPEPVSAGRAKRCAPGPSPSIAVFESVGWRDGLALLGREGGGRLGLALRHVAVEGEAGEQRRRL